MASEESVRASIVETVSRMCQAGFVVGTAGNVSARKPGGEQFWITPSGVDYATLKAADLVCVDLSGRALAGALKPSSDTAHHAAIFRLRDDVAGIVHTHSTYATVFAVLRREIPALLVEAAGYLGGAVPVIDYIPPATPQPGEHAAQGLARHRAFLLPNHGVIAVGDSAESALTAAVLVEQSARVAYLALLLGEPAVIPPGEVERMEQFLHHEYGQRPASASRAGSA